MKPIIKWPGGKQRELDIITDKAPKEFGTYFDPFVGGGGVLFGLEPAVSVVGDAHEALIELYRSSASESPILTCGLGRLAEFWDHQIPELCASQDVADLVEWFRDGGDIPSRDGDEAVRSAVGTIYAPLRDCMTASLADKLSRTRRREERSGSAFRHEDVPALIETGIRAGFYLAVRDGAIPLPEVVRFTFLRELCYGAMFRTNKLGKFNVPYGGRSYNSRRLEDTKARIFDPKRQAILAGSTIEQGCFRQFFRRWKSRMGPDDFVFLDPPYDSAFSNYSQPFTARDQSDLADAYVTIPSSVVAIMGASKFVVDLYQAAAVRRERATGRSVYLEEYSKKYGFNIKGRNGRWATHLVVWDE